MLFWVVKVDAVLAKLMAPLKLAAKLAPEPLVVRPKLKSPDPLVLLYTNVIPEAAVVPVTEIVL